MARKRYGRTQYEVTPEEFAKTWNIAETADIAAKALGMPLPIVLARVSNYRKRGIPMKKMPRRNSRSLDVDKISREVKRLYGRTSAVRLNALKEDLAEKMTKIPDELQPLVAEMIDHIAVEASKQGAMEAIKQLKKEGKI